MKTFGELAACLARIPPKITFYGLLYEYNYVGCLLLLMFSSDLLFAVKRDAYIFRKQDAVVRFRSIRSSKSRRSLEKSGKLVDPNFTMKPNTKARSLQFCIGSDLIIPSLWRELLEVRWQCNGILFNSRYPCCVTRQFNVHKGSIDQKDRFLPTSLFLWSLH